MEKIDWRKVDFSREENRELLDNRLKEIREELFSVYANDGVSPISPLGFFLSLANEAVAGARINMTVRVS